MPPGEVGLLRYRGPGCATTYHRDPDASVEAFRDGWFYPGDLAFLDVEGYVTLRDRQKDMIIRGGIDALLDFARARLPRPKWPRQIVVVDDLPRNSSGKVLKRELAQRASAAGPV